jgi:hypothetical protein
MNASTHSNVSTILRLSPLCRHNEFKFSSNVIESPIYFFSQSFDFLQSSFPSLSILPNRQNFVNNDPVCSSISTSFSPYNSSSASLILEFFKNGHIKMPKLIHSTKLSHELLVEVKRLYEINELTAYHHKIKVLFSGKVDSEKVNQMSKSQCLQLLKEVDSYDIPFMQLFNLWSNSSIVSEYSCSRGLGNYAYYCIKLPIVYYCIKLPIHI